MKKDHCAPNNIKGTCFPTPVVIKLASAVSNKIKISKDGEQMMSEVRSKLNCKDDLCVLKKKVIGDDLSGYFKPSRPKTWDINKNEWASTTDIDDVLKQYEGKYEDFKYLGAVPIDFDKKISSDTCISNDLCKINMKKLWDENYRKLGMVFNLDPHDKPGSHWVSMFVDMKNGGIYYFDSVGTYPPKEVQALMGRIATQLNNCLCDKTINKEHISDIHSVEKYLLKDAKKGSNKLYLNTDWLVPDTVIFIENTPYKVVDVKPDESYIQVEPSLTSNYKKNTRVIEKCWRQFYNDIQHQQKNTECGIYSMYFITELLKGKNFSDFLGRRIPDEHIEKYRYKFYRPRIANEFDISDLKD